MSSNREHLIRKLRSHVPNLEVKSQTIEEPKMDLDPPFFVPVDNRKSAIELLKDRSLSKERILDVEKPVEQLAPDLLAYYLSFRPALTNPNSSWGIFFILPNFEDFCARIARIANLPIQEVIEPAFDFIWQHEANHFESDLATFMIELNKHGTFQSKIHTQFCPDEESLGQVRGWKKINGRNANPDVARAIRDLYENSSLHGYKDFRKYEYDMTNGFDEIVKHRLQNSCSPQGAAPLVALTMSQKILPASRVPLTFECTSAPFIGMQLMTPTSVVWSSSAAHDRDKKIKKNREYGRLIEKAIGLLKKDPHHPSLEVKKFQTRKNFWEARLNKGERILFTYDDSGTVLIHEIGKDIYRH